MSPAKRAARTLLILVRYVLSEGVLSVLYSFETLTLPRAQKKTVLYPNPLKLRVSLFVTRHELSYPMVLLISTCVHSMGSVRVVTGVGMMAARQQLTKGNEILQMGATTML